MGWEFSWEWLKMGFSNIICWIICLSIAIPNIWNHQLVYDKVSWKLLGKQVCICRLNEQGQQISSHSLHTLVATMRTWALIQDYLYNIWAARVLPNWVSDFWSAPKQSLTKCHWYHSSHQKGNLQIPTKILMNCFSIFFGAAIMP